MLVSVTERTREIGLRMAVGRARGATSSRQFLIEAVVLCLAGGLIGLVLGWPRSLGHCARERAVAGAVSSPAITRWRSSPSALVGVFFGFWPARRAARLRPDRRASRHE